MRGEENAAPPAWYVHVQERYYITAQPKVQNLRQQPAQEPKPHSYHHVLDRKFHNSTSLAMAHAPLCPRHCPECQSTNISQPRAQAPATCYPSTVQSANPPNISQSKARAPATCDYISETEGKAVLHDSCSVIARRRGACPTVSSIPLDSSSLFDASQTSLSLSLSGRRS